MTPSDLDLVETDDLLNALYRRYDTIVFMGCKDRGETAYETKVEWRGNHVTGLGMVRVLGARLLKKFEALPRKQSD